MSKLDDRHKEFRQMFAADVVKAERQLLKAKRMRSTYYLLSMVSLWIKTDRELKLKAFTLDAVSKYVERSLNGFKETQKEESTKG